MTKLSSTLPGGDNNGLGALARALTMDPHKTAIIVAVVDCKSITIDTDTGDKVATVRIRRVEPIDPQDTDQAQRLLVRGLERRTGAVMLPIDLEDELSALFANLVESVDFETGKLRDGEQEDAAAKTTENTDELPEPAPDLAAEIDAVLFVEPASTAIADAVSALAAELDATDAAALDALNMSIEPVKPKRSHKKKPQTGPVTDDGPDLPAVSGPPWAE